MHQYETVQGVVCSGPAGLWFLHPAHADDIYFSRLTSQRCPSAHLARRVWSLW